MKMLLKNPSQIILPSDSEAVKSFLTFTDRSVNYQIKRLKDNYRWKNSDPESFQERLETLKDQAKVCLLDYDEDGNAVTYSGLANDLNGRFGWELPDNESKLTDSIIPWNKPPEYSLRYYQRDAVDALFKVKHGAVSLPTGSGKSAIIYTICKENPVQTLIMTPSKSITNQIYNEFITLFGKKRVGKYGDGKKEIGKLFTVATGQALTRVEKGTEEYEFLSKTQQFIADESHTTPAETFEKVCLGVAKNSQFRFFVSATQIRTDGSELVLKGITGPIVYAKSFRELVNEGYLAKPIVRVIKAPATGFSYTDINKETRAQLYLNPEVNRIAAEFATKAVTIANRPTVILIEEFRQFVALKNHIGIPFSFAHGGASDREDASGVKLKDILPQEYWKCDVEEEIRKFNSGETKLLIGTSAISTGVDIKPTGCIIYLQGGMSEISLKQGLGRATRMVPGKIDFIAVDFLVEGSPAMERHFQARLNIYQELTDDIEYLG
jgi:superfamily II DNA or RNA helicase